MKEYAAAISELSKLFVSLFSPKATKARHDIYRNTQRKKALRTAQKCQLLDADIKKLRNEKKRTQVVIKKIILLEDKKYKYWKRFNRLLVEE